MKIFCVPSNARLSIPADTNLVTVLFGRAETPVNASIGAAVLESIQKRKIAPTQRAWDFLSIALSVITADTSVCRNESPDGWTREIDIRIAVSDPEFWTTKSNLLARQLQFLTTDIWQLSFSEGGFQPPHLPNPLLPSEDCVSLFSGGLDSFIGAIDLAHKGLSPYLVSQVSHGDKRKQACFASQIGTGLRLLQLNHNARYPGKNERSQRARSFIFLVYGVLLATALQRYRDGEQLKLYVCENGYISLNPPLTGMRIGSLSTKTTHPIFLGLFQQLLDESELRVKVENPYQFKTKGQMLSECLNQQFLQKHAHETTSCGRFARNGHKHCGRCLPCLIRRSSFHAWGISDQTEYVFDDLSTDDESHKRFDDVRAAAMAVAEVEADGFNRLYHSSLNSTLMGDTTPYKEVIQQGLKEISEYLKSVGVI